MLARLIVSTPHDRLFKFVFSRPEHAAGAFRSWLPEVIAEQLDLSTLSEATDRLLGADLTARFCDLLFEVAFLETDAVLLMLHEADSVRGDCNLCKTKLNLVSS